MRLVVDGLIFQKDPHGGIARIFREVLPRLCELAPDLQVTLFLDGPVQAELPAHPQITVQRAPAVRRTLRVHGLAGRMLFPFRRLASRLWNRLRGRWLGTGQGAIWHSTYYSLPPEWQGAQVVTVYDMLHEQLPELFSDPMDEVGRQQKRRCVQQAQAVMCISESTRQAVVQHYALDPARLHLIYNAYNPLFRCLSDAPPERELKAPFVLYVGSRVHYKNFSGLLAAYRTWRQRPQVRLLVVGAPWSQDERRALRAAGLARDVLLLSAVDDQRLCRLYNQAAAFIYPSLAEGFGIPLLEAMACGCPLVAARIPPFLEVAGEAGYYFRPDSPAELQAALDAALDAGRAASQVAAGLARVQQFTWERTAAQMLAVYRGLDV